jgi:hypothetical protein
VGSKVVAQASQLVALFDRVTQIIPWVYDWMHRPVIQLHADPNTWVMSESSGRSAIVLNSTWYVTNRSDRPLRILAAEVKRPKTRGTVLVRSLPDGGWSEYAISPKETAVMAARFVVEPPISRRRKIIFVDVTFTDSFGQRVTKKRVAFKAYKRKDRPVEIEFRSDLISDLPTEIERRIATVTREELAWVRKKLRDFGELGSIEVREGGTLVAHFASDSGSRAEPDALVAHDLSEVKMTSTNADPLIAVYRRLSPSEQAQFVAAIVERFDRARDTFGVMYLLVYILIRLRMLDVALRAIETRLAVSRTWWPWPVRARSEAVFPPEQNHGESRIYELLGGMLRWCHDEFTDSDLDLIERHLKERPGFSFTLFDKIAAVRKMRWASNPDPAEGVSL